MIEKFFIFFSLILIIGGCEKNPDNLVLNAFENIHSSSVYYVVQNEEANIVETIGDLSFVELCYEIRRDLGALFKKECTLVKLKFIDEEWEISQSLFQQDDQNCWIVDKTNPFKVIKNYSDLKLKEIPLCQ